MREGRETVEKLLKKDKKSLGRRLTKEHKRYRETKDHLDQGREKSLRPSPRCCSHGTEDGFPCVRPDVGAVVLIEAFSWPTVEAPNPKSLLHAQMVLESLLVFHVGT